jgi:CYTH domain-containing protein
MSGFEIERKFLVHKDKDYKSRAYAYSYIKQGYIAAKRATVRVRVRDDRAYLTIKGPSTDGGLKRYEFEKEISLDEARHLFELCEPGVVEKTRYLVRSGDHIVEVDEFAGDNEGLVLAEIELGAEDEAFELPDFIGMEVTGDVRFYNKQLRRFPYVIWRGTLPPEYQ